MYALLLVLASAQALKRPQRALAVRGGEIDPITVGKGVVLASGLYGAFDPKGNLDKYGIKAEAKGQAAGRCTAWMQIMFAAALNLDPESVHAQMMYHMLAVMVIVPEPLRGFRGPEGGRASSGWLFWARSGTRPSTAPSTNGSPRLSSSQTVRSSSSRLIPSATASGIKGANKICKAMFSLMGGQMLCTGTYLGALLMDKSQSAAFAYAMAVNGVAAANTPSRMRTTSRPRRPARSPGPLSRRASPTRPLAPRTCRRSALVSCRRWRSLG